VKQKSPQPGPNYQSSLELFRISESLWESSRVFLARWGLSPSQFNILNLLLGRPDGCQQGELSRELIMHRSNVTGMVDRLSARGLVQRQDAPTDRRAFNVVLTDAGKELLRQIQPEYYESLEEIWTGLGVDEAKALVLKLQTIAGKANEVAHANARSGSPPRNQEGGSHGNQNSRSTHPAHGTGGAFGQGTTLS
jgi:DNA-binding MarR family transcriptional regulator